MVIHGPTAKPVTTAGGIGLLDAWDLIVTTEGRVFAADAFYSEMSGMVARGLVELAPLPNGIRGGDVLAVEPEGATLSRLLPDGGGEFIHQGEPFQRPTAVAAAGGVIAVGDSGLGKVLVSKLDDQGQLGPWSVLAEVGQPTGMDEVGCWIWSAVQPCDEERPCEDGVCGGPWCLPTCDTWQTCGPDGCTG